MHPSHSPRYPNIGLVYTITGFFVRVVLVGMKQLRARHLPTSRDNNSPWTALGEVRGVSKTMNACAHIDTSINRSPPPASARSPAGPFGQVLAHIRAHVHRWRCDVLDSRVRQHGVFAAGVERGGLRIAVACSRRSGGTRRKRVGAPQGIASMHRHR